MLRKPLVFIFKINSIGKKKTMFYFTETVSGFKLVKIDQNKLRKSNI